MEKERKRQSWQWNPEVLIESSKDDAMVLRNDMNGMLTVLSRPEYDMLQAYVTDNSFSFVSEAMGEYEIDDNVFLAVTEKARQLDIIVPWAMAEAMGKRRHRQSAFKMKAVYLTNFLVSFLQHFTPRTLKAECSGNLRFFRLCSVDLEGGVIHRMATSRDFQRWLPVGFMLLLAALAVSTAYGIKNFQFAGFGIDKVSVWALSAAMAVSISACLLWHECGHYIVYKRYGGSGNDIGIGTMFGFFPVVYTRVDDMHLWTDRRRRIILTVAGIINDLTAFMACSIFLCTYHKATFISLLAGCLFFYYVVQIITNLNIFMPGTDGYYLFEEITGRERVYGRASEEARCLWKNIVHGRIERIDFRQVIRIAYFLTCCLCITLYWAFAVLCFTFPLWGEIIFSL